MIFNRHMSALLDLRIFWIAAFAGRYIYLFYKHCPILLFSSHHPYSHNSTLKTARSCTPARSAGRIMHDDELWVPQGL
ncbi:hypothetical protein BJY04DRAFT_193734 [Aspergillus karnatakaensis]|uniref:uncharacterized protein n=1 Tax=Aspergillus karnatakaensis TaxID=1810916 RepID=UPI003CCD61BA